ncbi:MerR family transcriptional regulator [Pseudonocardia sp. ICBG162]|uniref:MerR family transcriptional regulator n=1 Tax=Pseudonocardia sp. ICBG162 TaxID=2846761 RepID=UPI001CF61F6E|nr:MerR family transcriptional regulator [Pseudonocardia sp. ICBG162]
MTWSTREIAELAGTSLRAVRHYHEVGLLTEPARRANGYKQYGVEHLVRLLRIKRLADLGFSLPQIADTLDDRDHPEQALRTLDAELAATVDRLQRARVELAAILDRRAPADLPVELVPAQASSLTDADRSLVLLMTRVMGPRKLAAYGALLRDMPADPTDGEFDALHADAGEDVRRDLAERMLPHVRRVQEAHPELRGPDDDAPRGARVLAETTNAAMQELYNPAQVDVLVRVAALLRTDH